MKRLSLILACIAVLILTILSTIYHHPSSITAQDGDPTPPRTYYDSLDLESPESAVMTFTDAFQRRDFPTILMVFSLRTQTHITQVINLLRYDDLIRIEQVESRFDLMPGIREFEHSPGRLDYVFDIVMLFAIEHEAFLIDLSGDVTIIESRAYSPEAEDEERTFMDVVTTVENIEGDVIFRMVQAPSGRWRVEQVITEGGDVERIPWSIPAPTVLEAFSVWTTPCEDELVEPALPTTTNPAIIVDPPCGTLGATASESTPVTVTGINFEPEVAVQLDFLGDGHERIQIETTGPIIPDQSGAFMVLVTPVNLGGNADLHAFTVVVRQTITHYP